MGRMKITGGVPNESVRKDIAEYERAEIIQRERKSAMLFLRMYALDFDMMNDSERLHLLGVLWDAWQWAHPELRKENTNTDKVRDIKDLDIG